MPPWTARGLLGRLKRRFSAARPGGLPFAPTEKQKRIPLLAAPENTADENCKITEPMHFWTWVLLRAFCTTF